VNDTGGRGLSIKESWVSLLLAFWFDLEELYLAGIVIDMDCVFVTFTGERITIGLTFHNPHNGTISIRHVLFTALGIPQMNHLY